MGIKPLVIRGLTGSRTEQDGQMKAGYKWLFCCVLAATGGLWHEALAIRQLKPVYVTVTGYPGGTHFEAGCLVQKAPYNTIH